jgi:glycosyltransferase involved in cell wall biosynthesis
MRVNVIVPCHNAARFIGEALESALHQTHRETTVLVVDDGSTDASAEVAASYGERVMVMLQPKRGVSAARNRALDVSDAEFIAFLDADDRWHPKKLSRQLAFFEDHPECGLAHTAVRYIDAAGRETKGTTCCKAQGDCLAELLACNSIITSSVLVRRELLNGERFLPELHTAEDWDLWLRLAARAPVGYVDEVLTDYRVHDANTSRLEELMLRGQLTVTERALARGLAPAHWSLATCRRRRFAATLAHFAYERGDMQRARHLFRQAGTSLDGVGVVRYAASSLPKCVRQPLRQVWRHLFSSRDPSAAGSQL